MNDQGTAQAGVCEPSAVRPELLQQARERAGLHIAAMAAALKVPVRKLEALEAGRYDELPDLIFARALASSACRHLRIDPAPVLAQIPQERRPLLGAADQSLNTPFRAGRDGAVAAAPGSSGHRVWWAALALVLAAVALYFWPATLDRAPSIVPPPETTRQGSAADASPSPAAEGGQRGNDAGQALPLLVPEPPVAPASPVPASGAASVSSPEAPSAAPTLPAAASDRLLVIQARGETWIEVTNGAGSVVMQRVLRAGDSVDFSASPPYRVVIGRSDVVDVLVRGNAFDILPHARNNVARFEVR